MSIKSPKKLIEVALPLDDINEAAAKEKSIRHGHPSTLHLWWARRPLAAARAVIFAQMVNDPGGERGYYAGKTKQQANHERERLFDIMRRLVKWENTNNKAVLAEARAEILKSWHETCELNKGKPGFNPDALPSLHDPFAGGGAIPLEAQRLGLDSFASDLNPVAVLINKAMIEIPPRFAGRAPVGPRQSKERQGNLAQDWSGSKGLAEDVRRYGAWMREMAYRELESLYPKVRLPKEDGGGEATVIAWLWARTVRSPNPAYSHVEVPLTSSFILYNKSGKEAYIHPVVNGDEYYFEVKRGIPPASAKNGTKGARGANFSCLLSGSPIESQYIRAEAQAGRMGAKLLAIVAEGKSGRVYVSPSDEQEKVALRAKPEWQPDLRVTTPCHDVDRLPMYGMYTWGDAFTKRQLVSLNVFSNLIKDVREKVLNDCLAAEWTDDGKGIAYSGTGATAYADAIATYLSMTVSKITSYHCTLGVWRANEGKTGRAFGRHSIPMVWDFPESNPFAGAGGDFEGATSDCAKVIASLDARSHGEVSQEACQLLQVSNNVFRVISTDPPYYDNVAYAELSDFFYVWLRRTLRTIYPGLFSTVAVPKTEELVAMPDRHKSRDAAEIFFLDGMTEAMRRLSERAHPAFPTTIYYAFKQSDTTEAGTGNTGWETFLEAVIRAGFAITGTWPMRTEQSAALKAKINSLASSIILVCRKRDVDAPTVSRKDFLRELREVLPGALDDMLNGGEGRAPIAPVDLSQAVIGPGMAVFSKYKAVLEADGTPMTVQAAMTLINRFLDDGEDFDQDTRFCLGWFQQYGWATGQFGTADVLARSKGTSVDHIANAGVIESGAGRVRLLKIPEYPAGWDPRRDVNMPVWEALHHLIKALAERGVDAAGELTAKMPDRVDAIRQLAYRLYTLCERKGWAEDARAYNTIITSWSQVDEASQSVGHRGSQITMDV